MWRLGLTAGFAGVIVGAGSAAFGLNDATVWSGWTTNNIAYENRAEMVTDLAIYTATVRTRAADPNRNVGPNKMGGLPTMYWKWSTSAHSICRVGNWT